MRRVRTIIPHCDMDSSVIDSFQCDQCSWSYAMALPKSFLIAYEEVERACAAFDEHCCDNFNPRTVDHGARRVSESHIAAQSVC